MAVTSTSSSLQAMGEVQRRNSNRIRPSHRGDSRPRVSIETVKVAVVYFPDDGIVGSVGAGRDRRWGAADLRESRTRPAEEPAEIQPELRRPPSRPPARTLSTAVGAEGDPRGSPRLVGGRGGFHSHGSGSNHEIDDGVLPPRFVLFKKYMWPSLAIADHVLRRRSAGTVTTQWIAGAEVGVRAVHRSPRRREEHVLVVPGKRRHSGDANDLLAVGSGYGGVRAVSGDSEDPVPSDAMPPQPRSLRPCCRSPSRRHAWIAGVDRDHASR